MNELFVVNLEIAGFVYTLLALITFLAGFATAINNEKPPSRHRFEYILPFFRIGYWFGEKI